MHDRKRVEQSGRECSWSDCVLVRLPIRPQIKNGRLALGTWQGIYLNGECVLFVGGSCILPHGNSFFMEI
jgi:hypothetical protein